VTPVDIVLLVARTLESLGVPYVLVGSLASSARGVPRSTNDADIVAALSVAHVGPLVARLSPDFYVDEEAVRRAVAAGRSFNAIHQDTAFKIDVFVPPPGGFGHQQLLRRVREEAGSAASPQPLYIATAEDVVLAKLLWYKAGGRASDRQWQDIVGLIRVQDSALDATYLRAWASTLGLSDLLAQALAEGGAPF
jgi:hypothetical protein